MVLQTVTNTVFHPGEKQKLPDIEAWFCRFDGVTHRWYYPDKGYCDHPAVATAEGPRCEEHQVYLWVQPASAGFRYVCPIANCSTVAEYVFPSAG
jgi:hypothetical protein